MPQWVVTSAWYGHAPFAFWLVEALQPRLVVELGVYEGFSYFTFCQATEHYAPAARVVGIDNWEGDEHAGALEAGARRRVETHDELYGSRSSLVASDFDAAADRFSAGDIDLLHIDGLHTFEAVRHDFEAWLPRMSDKGVVLLHDSEVRERGFGVWRLLDELEGAFPVFRFTHDHGLGVVGVGRELPARIRTLLEAGHDEPSRTAVRSAYELLGSRIAVRTAASTPSLRQSRPAPESGSDRMRETLELRARLRASETLLSAIESSRTWRLTGPYRRGVATVREFHAALRRSVLLRVPVRLEARRKHYAAERAREWEEGSSAYANWIRTYDTFDAADIAGMHRLAASLQTSGPLISVILRVFDAHPRHLEQTIDSVIGQAYGNWQLCVADDSSTDPAVRSLLRSYADRDGRVDLVLRAETGGISAASNSALEIAEGDVISILDQDAVLSPHALLLVAKRFVDDPNVGFVYSDEDVIDEGGVRSAHHFKPDWNPELLRSQSYPTRLAAFRVTLAREVGGFRSEFDGNQDWDLVLRITALLDDVQIAHVPHVLYHRRSSPAWAVWGVDAKPYARSGGRAAVKDHLGRLGVRGSVADAGADQNVRYEVPAEAPRVTLVVPTTMRFGLFDALVAGLHNTPYRPLELVRVATAGAILGSPPLEAAMPSGAVAVDVELEAEGFNFSRAVNLGCAAASGSLLLILNDDIEILHADWLDIMVGHVTQAGVGAVGPLLLASDERVQHAGVMLGDPVDGPLAGHLYHGSTLIQPSYWGRLGLNQDLSCVTGACMLVRREAFDDVGGFDEAFAVAYNDVDFCLRLRERGWRIVFTPDAMLTHVESASFGSHARGRSVAHQRDVDEMRRRWRHLLGSDPAHNPNLALDWVRPGELAFPPRVSYPWRDPQRRRPAPSRRGSARAS
jgi:GT2 family glycosyltransferase